MAIKITDANAQEIISSGKPVVIDFWATWCGPCMAMAPLIDELATEYEGKVVIGKYNVDEEGDLSSEYRIMSLPTILFFKDGKKTDIRLAGSQTRATLESKIADLLAKVAADTMVGGATLTKLLGTSAWYAPGAAGAQMVAAILHNQKKLISASALLEGEYGESDLCIGVPCIIGRNGIEKIVTFDLNEEEKALFHKSAEAVPFRLPFTDLRSRSQFFGISVATSSAARFI